ncbi:hypothetical protein [Mucilaginibacter kameinonensis]|uniref:hypothetical protein n=1 Tax=Mucilaginibacter kameinonensis TaxID=452286 RepID=UPI0013CED2D9|nr:hypothetical protein [Mucilaginibacter kameinonensis]
MEKFKKLTLLVVIAVTALITACTKGNEAVPTPAKKPLPPVSNLSKPDTSYTQLIGR